MNRLPNLDPLRFVLATLVMLFHIPQLSRNQGLPYFNDWPIFHRGTEAVYVFFVLSGFLIIGQIYDYKQQGRFSIKNFYARRALRILPLYYLIVIFGFIFYNLIVPAMGFDVPINYELSEGILLTVFFLPNVFSSLYEPGGILEILWSIGIEEQFYLMIAPLLFFIKNKWLMWVLTLISIGYFILFHLEIGDILSDFGMVYFYLFSGGLIAILEKENKLEFLKKLAAIPLLISIFAVLFFVTDLLQFPTHWIRHGLSCVLFGLFVHTLAHNNRGVVIKSKVLSYFGNISYGIYMYHAIAMNLVVFGFMKLSINSLSSTVTILLINVLVFLLTLGVAHFSYVYLERYFLNLKSKFRK
ncbi:MAG: acyltransferase [Bacteroidetes bacterium]|nr:acyltransferase [Bacteroidota bacterium]